MNQSILLGRLHRAMRALNRCRIDGETFDRIHERIGDALWLEEYFRYELCHECGGDAENHTVGYVMGNRFAWCNAPAAAA